jgi:hypothetical protein
MKIAALIIAHDNPRCLTALLDVLEDHDFDTYLLLDAKSNDIFDDCRLGDRPVVLVPRMSMYWGGYSLVLATLKLIDATKGKYYDYFMNFSGVDYPVKPLSSLFQRLSDGEQEYISSEEMPSPTKPLFRLEAFTFQRAHRPRNTIDQLYRYADRLSRSLYGRGFYQRNFKRSFGGMVPYAGSQWWAFTHECMMYIRHYIENNPAYLRQFRYTFCADEIFFHTIVMNSPYKEKVAQGMTHAVWDEPLRGMPAIVTAAHVRQAASSGNSFFIRKFSDREYETLEYARTFVNAQESLPI